MELRDVIIVGGGPAGSSCAWSLVRRGYDCLILDRCRFPRTKLCAGWITPAVLRDLEFHVNEYPHGILTFRSLHVHLNGRLWRIPTTQHSIRRYEFDEWLLRRSGAVVAHHDVKRIQRTASGFEIDERYACRYLVGAGGTHCPVARTFFVDTHSRGRGALIVTQEAEFEQEVLIQDCHLWFLEEGLPGYSWYVPKAGGYVNVGVGGSISHLDRRRDRIRRHWDLLVHKLRREGFIKSTPEPKGHSYYLRERRGKVQTDGTFIIGDAAGLATVDMGEGIHPAVRSGLLAADAMVHNRPWSLDSIREYSFLPRFLLDVVGRFAA
jgi:flavin-dependent dehydrogenase